MKVLIVEDEPFASARLRELIAQHDARITVIDELDSVEDAVQFFKSGRSIDVLFLDIQLSDGVSFEIFERVRVSCPVIFTTAYDQYALQAFRVQGIDYLLKPIDLSDLQRAFAQVDRFLPQPEHRLLQQAYRQPLPTYKSRFLVKTGDHYQTIPVEDIGYLYADGKVTYLVSRTNQRRYLLDHTLETLETTQLDPKQFFRINRKFMVPIDGLREVHSYVNGRLKVLTLVPSENDMIVSRERVSAFKAWLDQ
ncbi:MAG: LytTR family DNA-binding domain-containing protein [Tunicatimonas sp.]